MVKIYAVYKKEGKMEKVKKFCYLITRIGKANSVFGRLEYIWKKKRLGIKTKIQLYKALVLSTL